ncbi:MULTISPECIES: hypothetical protein [unclassified Pseudoalteromonas]|uniref:hypothetical protein n=1 Tax=unclassified Pseudoalteromonas TaxID=194690 RepID=UPI000CB36C0B|nr:MULTISPECIES: hypothetical protein [unclassified Pseudoalteromonas]MBH0062452.1 hypothetical protein [Pseudoalteromonas sp. NZS71]PLT25441.1 hypothetical protein CXF89_10485 [Pseudoalteromonas sp. MelDa3]
MLDFIFGISTSIVATGLIFLTRNFWVSSWHKLYSKIYPKIDGRFAITFGNVENQLPWFENERSEFELKQYGKNINGFYKVYSDNNLKLSFKVFGFVTADKILVLNYESKDASTKGAGSFVFTITGISKNIIGASTYVCSQCDDVHTFPCKLDKVEN